MSEATVFMFPIKNEQGFKVVDQQTYAHMIKTIVSHTVQLQEEYPDKRVLVVYEA